MIKVHKVITKSGAIAQALLLGDPNGCCRLILTNSDTSKVLCFHSANGRMPRIFEHIYWNNKKRFIELSNHDLDSISKYCFQFDYLVAKSLLSCFDLLELHEFILASWRNIKLPALYDNLLLKALSEKKLEEEAIKKGLVNDTQLKITELKISRLENLIKNA